MTDQAGPTPPDYAHPSLAGRLEELCPDGSRWRWMGDRWMQIAPPGTFAAEVAREEAVTRTIDAAFQGVREGHAPATIVERLRRTAGDRTVLETSLARSGKLRHPWGDRVRELLRAAAGSPEG